MMTKFNNDDHNIVDDIKYSGAVTVGAENNYLNSYLYSYILIFCPMIRPARVHCVLLLFFSCCCKM